MKLSVYQSGNAKTGDTCAQFLTFVFLGLAYREGLYGRTLAVLLRT